MVSMTLIEKLELLSPELQNQIEKDIDKLLEKDDVKESQKPRARFGDLKGFVKYISDDFDEPLEDFKDYM